MTHAFPPRRSSDLTNSSSVLGRNAASTSSTRRAGVTRRFVSVMVCIYLFRHCRERRTKTKKPAGISNEGQINGISLRSFLEREPHQCIQCGAAAQSLLSRSDEIGRASCRERGCRDV